MVYKDLPVDLVDGHLGQIHSIFLFLYPQSLFVLCFPQILRYQDSQLLHLVVVLDTNILELLLLSLELLPDLVFNQGK